MTAINNEVRKIQEMGVRITTVKVKLSSARYYNNTSDKNILSCIIIFWYDLDTTFWAKKATLSKTSTNFHSNCQTFDFSI